MTAAGHRLPLGPLLPVVAAAIAANQRGAHDRGGIGALGWGNTQEKSWFMARRRGYLTVYAADQMAVALGLHPWQIWGDAWWWPYLSAEAS